MDTGRREVVAPGLLNDVSVVEFVAGTREGIKAYETLLTLDTDAISYNAALLLIGLDAVKPRPAERQFDPVAPAGHPVEITLSWMEGGTERRIAIEELLYDERHKKTLPAGPWVYTGSTFVGTGKERRFLAELEGVLIGLMRAPQALIDNPRNDVLGGFGSIILNPKLPFPESTTLSLRVKALDRDAARKQ